MVVIGFARSAGLVRSSDPIPYVPRFERGVDAETLRPWSSINANFLQSPFGVNGRTYVVTEPAPKVAPVLRDELPVRSFASGRLLVVGQGGYETLADAVAASLAGDRVLIRPGRHPGGHAIVKHDLLIEGEPDAVVVWSGGRGPFIEIGGADVRLVLRSLRLEAFAINSNLIGDPNPAYGGAPIGFHPHLLIEDSFVLSHGGSSVYFDSPGSVVQVHRAQVGSISLSNGALLELNSVAIGNQTILGGQIVGSRRPGVARGVCVICLRDVEFASLDNLSTPQEEGELLVANSVGRVVVGPRARNLKVRLMQQESRELGVLPLPAGYRFEFRVVNGVAEF
jgi:hypothetical protein